MLGGTLGIGTVLYALLIGPLTQAFLGPCVVPLSTKAAPTVAPVRGDAPF